MTDHAAALNRLAALITSTNQELSERRARSVEMDRAHLSTPLDMEGLARRTADHVTIALLQVRRDALTDAYDIFAYGPEPSSTPMPRLNAVLPEE